MSEGVASIFKQEFGRPSSEDFLGEFLTCQTVHEGATVYGLVTKPRFNVKPDHKDYELAFSHLIADFNGKKLTKLICSPMGCTRNKISLEKFAASIVFFHQCTGASVEVINTWKIPTELCGMAFPTTNLLTNFSTQFHCTGSGHRPSCPNLEI